jgi:CheY-like chemotaxis protein
MTEPTLLGHRIFVVEDDYFIADALRIGFETAGAKLIGPVGMLEDALGLIRSGQPIDGAVIDISLHGESGFPAADLLLERGVPFVFLTGYDAATLPPRFSGTPVCRKSIDIAEIAGILGPLLSRI